LAVTFRTYKIKKSDTIESIAQELNLDVGELKNYHNNKSRIDNRILLGIPGHVTKLIVPPKGFILKDGKEVWATGDKDEPIPFNLSYSGKLFNTNCKGDLGYGVFKTIQSGTKTNTIAYNISLRFYPKNEKDKQYVSLDIISKTYINNKEPDIMIDELALACTKALYPVVFQIDINGLLLGIQNHDDIILRWKKQKEKNLKYYKGAVAKKYCDLFGQTLKDKDTLFHCLQNDWFLHLYFNDLYTTYNNDRELKRTLEFPILPNTGPVQFNIVQEVDPYLSNGHVKLELKGECSDPRSKEDLGAGQFFPSMANKKPKLAEGEYRARYYLHPTTKKIQSAFLQCSLKLDKEKSIFISISEIKDEIKGHKRHPDRIVELKEKKESFLKQLFS